jgi:RNA polymerase sigma-32 factor
MGGDRGRANARISRVLRRVAMAAPGFRCGTMPRQSCRSELLSEDRFHAQARHAPCTTPSEMQHVTMLDRYRASLGHVEPLSPQLELELARAWQKGDADAGRRLVESSLPFVIRVAREYRRWGVPLEDLVQQGNLGLLKAASRYDTGKECRLITYAVYWIRAEIRDYVVRSYRIVRLGSTRTERRAMRAFRRTPVDGPDELAKASGMPVRRAAALWPLLCGVDVSLDQRIGDRGPAIDRVESIGRSPEEELAAHDESNGVKVAIRKALRKLDARERRIVLARLMSDEPLTLEALGNELGVSKERVRQLEERVRRKLELDLAEFAPAA